MMNLAATVSIGVFSLFHPREVYIEPFGPSRVEVRCGSVFKKVLEGTEQAHLSSDCAAGGLNGVETDFVLSIPGKIRRHYRGSLKTIRPPNGEVIAVVTMTLEIAVASTVAAEAPPSAPAAMLEAQAIVTRSYFAASSNHRHHDFDFCDTTHCQFIRDPPPDDSPASQAARTTAGQVLEYHDRVIAAFYASRCDGLLAPLPASRVGPGDYPYFAVRCDYCHRHPSLEAAKSNARPHHHGMCQMGAADLAAQGWTSAQILAHYYPGAELR